MFRFTPLVRKWGKIPKSYGKYDLKTSLYKTKAFDTAERFSIKTEGEELQGMGVQRRLRANLLKESLEEMEHPIMWIWYPWRANPEPPVPALPQTRALKNTIGAIDTGLTPTQKRRHDEMYGGIAPPAERDRVHDQNHAFLAQIIKDLHGNGTDRPVGFPFFFKKYPTRRSAYVNRFSIPSEMLQGYRPEIKMALSNKMMTRNERMQAQINMYAERYALSDLDNRNIPVLIVRLAIKVREFRNHLLQHPKNNVYKIAMLSAQRRLSEQLKLLRRENFQLYWQILREHDIQDLVQPTNEVDYRWGKYWRHEWNQGRAIKTRIEDFMDPRGLNGCIETGRSRSEVARDLGLTYTRTLNLKERQFLCDQALYFDRVSKFRAEQPQRAREVDRIQYIRKFTGMFSVMNKKARTVDFPSRFRRLLGTKITRWTSCRHGPM